MTLISNAILKAQENFSQLVKELQISRVIYIDDIYDYKKEDIVNYLKKIFLEDVNWIKTLLDISLSTKEDKTIWLKTIEQRYYELKSEDLDKVAKKVMNYVVEHNLTDDLETTETISNLKIIMKKISESFLTICAVKEWIDLIKPELQKEMESYSKEILESKKILFLVDEDLSKAEGFDDKGIEILKRISDESYAYCGLFSRTFKPSDEWTAREKFKDDVSLEKFILISKHRLLKDTFKKDPNGIVRSIKRTVLNPYFKKLVEETKEHIIKTIEEVSNEIHEFGVLNFEHVIFNLSKEEGLWEADMLYKLFSLKQRDRLYNSLLDTGKSKLNDLTNEVRKISAIPTGRDENVDKEKLYNLQQIDRYMDGNLLKKYNFPLECGDIFLKPKQKPEDKDKYYILISQPCDLVLRNNGSRHHDVYQAFLVEMKQYYSTSMKLPGLFKLETNNFNKERIVEIFEEYYEQDKEFGKKLNENLEDWFSSENNDKAEILSALTQFLFDNEKTNLDPEKYYRLPCLTDKSEDVYIVNFRKRHSILLEILDYCVCDKEGRLKFNLNNPLPENMRISWKKRFDNLKKEVDKAIKHREKFDNSLNELMRYASEMSSANKQKCKECASNIRKLFVKKLSEKGGISGKIDLELKEIEYPLTRVKRLMSPYKEELLIKFTQHISRPAIDLDLAKRLSD